MGIFYFCSHQSRDRLADLVAEHLDHLHYLNDILCLNIDALNDVLTDQILNRLLIPLYVYSLTMRKRAADRLVLTLYRIITCLEMQTTFLLQFMDGLIKTLTKFMF